MTCPRSPGGFRTLGMEPNSPPQFPVQMSSSHSFTFPRFLSSDLHYQAVNKNILFKELPHICIFKRGSAPPADGQNLDIIKRLPKEKVRNLRMPDQVQWASWIQGKENVFKQEPPTKAAHPSPHPVTSPSGQVPSESPWRLVETYLPSLTRHHHSPVGCRIEIPRAKAALFLPFVGFRKKLRLACPKKTKTPAWNIKIFRGKLGKKEGKIPLWGIFFLGRKEKPRNEILGQLSNSVFCFSEHHATMTAEYCGHCQRCTDQGPRGHWTPACQFVAWAWGSICPEGNTFCEFIQNTLQVSMGYLWPILVIFG